MLRPIGSGIRRSTRWLAEAAGLGPARLSFGRGEARFGVNRRVPEGMGSIHFGANRQGIAEPDVPVLLVESAGDTLAVVFSYACHNTTIRNGHDGFYRYHPDYAGVAAEQIEKQLPGATAIYVTGTRAKSILSRKVEWNRRRDMDGALAAVVLATLDGTRRHRSTDRCVLPTGRFCCRWPRSLSRAKYVELSASTIAYRRRHAHHILAQMDTGTLPREVPLPIQVWWFGEDLTLVALAGEVGVDYALRLKREFGAGPGLACRLRERGALLHSLGTSPRRGGLRSRLGPGPGSRSAGSDGQHPLLRLGGPATHGGQDRILTTVHSLLNK